MRKGKLVKKALLCILTVLWLPVSSVMGSETDLSKDGLSFADLAKAAVLASPEIKAAEAAWLAAIERLPQVRGLENPILQYGHFLKSVETRVGPQQDKVAISQKIPFPGKLSTKGDIAYKNALVAQVRFRKVTGDIMRRLKDAYLDIIYFEKAINIVKKNTIIADHLLEAGAADYSGNMALLSDVFKAEAQRAQLDYDLMLLVEQRDAQAGQINAILNREPDQTLGNFSNIRFQEVVLDLEQLYDSAKKNAEDLAIAALVIEKAEDGLKLAKVHRFPDFQVGLTYIGVGDAEGLKNAGKDAYMASAGITLPIWTGQNSARIEEARQKKIEAEQKKTALENRIFSDIKKTYYKIRNLKRLVILYDESLIPQAAESMRLAETWYKEGNGSFSGMLEVESVWLRFNLMRERALSDYYKALAHMERLTGNPLLTRVSKHQTR